MDVAVRRSFDRRHPCTCRLDDGAVVRFDMWEDSSGLPHDLVHFAVEGSLGLRHGFWGLTAAGADLASLRRVGGPGRPTDPGSLVDAHRAQLLEAEAVVGACWDLWSDRRTLDAARAGLAWPGLAEGAPPDWWTEDAADRAFAAVVDLRAAWEETAPGDVLRLTWPPPTTP